MEVISYTPPTSWDDKGMEWGDNIDVAKLDYAVAIREAIFERMIVTSAGGYSGLYLPGCLVPLRYDFLISVRAALYFLIPCFVNLEYQDYKEDFSDYPKMWTLGDIMEDEKCRFAEMPGRCSPISEWNDWFNAVRNVLNKLTVIKDYIKGTCLTRSGSTHDPPFSESISTALQRALEGEPGKSSGNYSFPVNFFAWSGNTHYKKDPDGYCGYAYSRAYKFEMGYNPYRYECDFILTGIVKKPEGAVAYSSELQKSVFSDGGIGLKEGIFMQKEHWSDKLEISLGNVDKIPKNSNRPSSTWSDSKTIKRSCKTGYEAKAWALLDFGVPGGFKFQA